ncbi:sulfurtransferase TusA family protein [Actinotalea sp. K2]|uniref:sulfurtransferase TusA family protein n=1 Tax=Actinotalea sp. K2 TaxID=2939438 RepID=UPI00201823AD|nr:sulfurtransferase TusA family protein [Actinotalea sp. K2]
MDPVHHLDGGDLECIRLLILLRNHAARLPAGTVVHLTTRDPVAPIDLPAWCRMTGHTYFGRTSDTGAPTYAVRIAASAVATLDDRPWHTTHDPGPSPA